MRIFANDGRVGGIYMNKGEIFHVEAGAMLGFNAILDLMRWTEGRIVVYDALLSVEKTNSTPTMHMIMDAARIMDEGFPEDRMGGALDAWEEEATPPKDQTPGPRAPAPEPKKKEDSNSVGFNWGSLNLD